MGSIAPTFDVPVNGTTFTFYTQDGFKSQASSSSPVILPDTIGYIATHATSPIKVIDRTTNPPTMRMEISAANIINNTPITPYTP